MGAIGCDFFKNHIHLKNAYYVSATGDTEEQKTNLCFMEL